MEAATGVTHGQRKRSLLRHTHTLEMHCHCECANLGITDLPADNAIHKVLDSVICQFLAVPLGFD